MSNYDQEQRQMDEVSDDLQLASILQTVGWVLMGFTGIIVNWVWVGFRSGSYLWLYWMMIEGGVGFSLAVVGSYLKTRSGRRISRLGPELYELTEPANTGERAA